MSWLDDVGKVIPIADLYRDLAQPATREVGEALGNAAKVARFVLAPIDYLAAQHQRWKRYLERVAEKVPEERRIEAHPQLAGPVFAGLQYVEETGINAELFLNLLARAIDRERVSEAHPAFAQLISQLSPDEALILFHLKKRTYAFHQHAVYRPDSNTFEGRTTRRNEFPVNELVFPGNFGLYMDHLHSLNLAGMWQDGNQEPIMEGTPPRQTGVNIKNLIMLESFGRMFAQACVPDDLNPQWVQGAKDA
jgi:Abortive infection alpha